jgi:hypothetical protein
MSETTIIPKLMIDNAASIQSLEKLTNLTIKTIDDLNAGKISLNQARIVSKLASDAIRATVAKAMLQQ